MGNSSIIVRWWTMLFWSVKSQNLLLIVRSCNATMSTLSNYSLAGACWFSDRVIAAITFVLCRISAVDQVWILGKSTWLCYSICWLYHWYERAIHKYDLLIYTRHIDVMKADRVVITDEFVFWSFTFKEVEMFTRLLVSIKQVITLMDNKGNALPQTTTRLKGIFAKKLLIATG